MSLTKFTLQELGAMGTEVAGEVFSERYSSLGIVFASLEITKD